MSVDSDGLKCVVEDGNEKLSVSIMKIDSSQEEMTYEDWIEENGLESAEAVLVVDLDKGAMLSYGDDPAKDEHVMIDVVDYSYGQLVGYFEVDGNVSIKDIDMKDFFIQLLMVDGEGEIRDITYGEGFTGTINEYEIYKLSYKGVNVELNLSFQGGSGDTHLFIRDDDGDLIQTEVDELNS